MSKQLSYGIIIYRINDLKIEYLIIKTKNQVIGFPKGHIEKDETELDTAFRETYEEVGLKPQLIGDFKESISYQIKNKNKVKTSRYFIGRINDEKVVYMDQSVISHKWSEFEDAYSSLQFEDIKKLFEKANEYVKNYEKL